MNEHAAGGAVILDGKSLAQRREADIARRAARVRTSRGRAPTLLLAAFADAQARVPHIRGKLHASERTGVETLPLIIPAASATADAVRALEEGIARTTPDAVFVQIPTPDVIDEDTLLGAVPPELDVDIMTPVQAEAYLSGAHDLPPVTVSGALQLLDASQVHVAALRGVLITHASTYSAMIVEAFRRRDATLVMVEPGASDLDGRIADAELVIAAAGQPLIISTRMLRAGCVALDFGYYNDDGRGDIDTDPGTRHLRALMPVPGGVGPMTVSALLERVVSFAAG